MSSTILLSPRAQLCIRYCSNKQQHLRAQGHSVEKGQRRQVRAARRPSLQHSFLLTGCIAACCQPVRRFTARRSSGGCGYADGKPRYFRLLKGRVQPDDRTRTLCCGMPLLLNKHKMSGSVCLLLQYLLESCSRGGRGIVEDMSVLLRGCCPGLPLTSMCSTRTVTVSH